MKTMIESMRRPGGKALAMVVIAALIGTLVGCGIPDNIYSLTIESTAGGSVTSPGERTSEYSAGTVVELEAVADVGHRFVEWTGDVSTIDDIEAATTRIAMDDDYSITANFEEVPAVRYELTISSTAGGSVTTPGEGTFTYDDGAVANLVASPAGGYRLVNWSGDVGTVANVSAESTTITMNGNYSITGNFVAVYDLSISSTAGGSVTTPGEGTFTYDAGAMVSLIAAADVDYRFVEWTGNVSTVADVYATSTNITINADYFIQASFEEKPVHFADANLEAAVREAIGIPDDPIYPEDLADLTVLTAEDMEISDLTGLEYCTGLTWLNLRDNRISDISPLASLANLRNLFVWGNQISDVSPLAKLTDLIRLHLGGNQISDVSPLEGLSNLMWLYLENNQIDDISPLKGLTNLTILRLGHNQIDDISPLKGLSNLNWLYLHNNQIDDISPLEGLTRLTWLYLERNHISDISPLEGLTNLTILRLGHNQIDDISPLEGLTNLTDLRLQRNAISDIKPLVDNAGLGEGDEIWLSWNPLSEQSINEYIPALQARGVVVHH